MAENETKKQKIKKDKPQQSGPKPTEQAAGMPLIDQIMEDTRIKSDEEGYEVAKTGIKTFLKELLSPDRQITKIDKFILSELIDEIDQRLSRQMDEILHNKDFQKIESTWRGLDLLVGRTDFRENIKMNLLNVSKEDLAEDFEDAPDIVNSGLYQHIYVNEYGQFGGEPVSAIIADYEFGPGTKDVALLRDIASVSTMSHAPCVAAASPKFFDIDSYGEMPGLRDLGDIFESPKYAKWKSFRESDDSRNVGLAMPRFMGRSLYDPEDNPAKSFNYNEMTYGAPENYLWCNTSFAFGTRMTESFAQYRWCPNVIGPQSGGAVLNLPVHNFEINGMEQTIGPMEVKLSDRREFELAEEGFIALTMRKGSDNATFFSANSAQAPKFFGTEPEGRQAELNFRLGTQLPYLFIITRLAHYIKMLQRENLGSWKTSTDLNRELNRWITQYVSNQASPPPGVRSRRPLRSAEIAVSDVKGEAGWFDVTIKVTPHIKFMGANFTLSLEGKLDTA